MKTCGNVLLSERESLMKQTRWKKNAKFSKYERKCKKEKWCDKRARDDGKQIFAVVTE
jgi:hypothetical protein